jgi:signal transduction histidine kinase
MKLPNLILHCFLLMLTAISARGQSADSLRSRMRVLSGERQNHLLKDTDYVRSMDSLVPFMVQEDSLPQWLSAYRDIAFANAKPDRHKAYYYTYMALNAANTRKLGSAIYYSEKNNTERVDAGLFEKGGIPHSDMFACVVYFGSQNYDRVIQKYLTLGPALRAMPAAAAAGNLSPAQAFVGLSIIQVAVFTYRQRNDTVHMDEAVQLARSLLDKIRQQPERYHRFRKQFDYLDHSIAFEERLGRDPIQAARLLAVAIEDVGDAAFPEGMRADYSTGLYTQAVDFYTAQHNRDSVKHYLALLGGVGENARESTTDMVFLDAKEADLLGDEGKYKEAYDKMRKAFQLRDSAYYSVSSDRDNNLYALAEAENTRADLHRTDEQKRAAERSNLILFFILLILVLGGAVSFFLYRADQRQRLLNLQLGLARNFHDSIGPMLIYANALVKKEMDDRQSPRLTELKSHVGLLMEEVRGISHDLKSNRLDTVTGFGRELTASLEKLQDATGIGFTLKVENGEKALTQLQLTHLSKIVHELVGNSVKHAGCARISLEMTGVRRSLQVHYSDDGKGMDPAVQPAGIGLQNIRERVASLRGSFHLDNAWPKGYSILILIPLL